MDALGLVLAILALWAWFEPRAVGKWLRNIERGWQGYE